jgi:uncharacterized protein YabE (DUF348 family)
MVDLKNYNARSLQRFFSNHLRMTVFMVVLAVLVSVFAYDMQKSVAVVVNGIPTEVSTYKTTVNGVLLSTGIGVGKKDKVLPELNSKITNGMTIAIKRAIPVNVFIDGKKRVINTAENTVGEMLKAEGIKLSKSDTVSPKIQSPVKKNMEVTVTRVAENTLTMTKKVAYKVFKKTDRNLDKGKVNVVRQGMEGKKEVKYKVIYQNGKEISRFLVSEVMKVAPVNKVIAVGALAWFTPIEGGRKEYFTKKLRVKATSYTKDYFCTGKRPGDRGFGITSTGKTAKRNKDGYSTIAVDKSVIPLGTKLYVEGYGYAVAEDIGGGVRGRHIDLYFEPGTEEYRSWFTHQVNVYVLK